MPLLRLKPLALCLAALLAIAAPTWATETIYSNFSQDPDSPLNPYADPAFGYQVSWTVATHWTDDIVAAQGAAYAMPFVNTLPVEASLNTVSLGVYKLGDGEAYDPQGDSLPVNHDNLSIILADSDPTGTLPGETLETLATNPAISEDTATFLTLTSAGTILKPGQTYWILLQPTDTSLTSADADTFYFWVQSKADLSYADLLNLYSPFDALGGWTGYTPQGDGPLLAPSLEVTVNPAEPVPEPGTAAMVAVSICSWALGRRNRQRPYS